MARIRTVKPDFWTDDICDATKPIDRLFFIGMWNFADDWGVLYDEPARLKREILPADRFDPEASIRRLLEFGCLRQAVAPCGQRVLVVKNFRKHQRIDKPGKPRWGKPGELSYQDIRGMFPEGSERARLLEVDLGSGSRNLDSGSLALEGDNPCLESVSDVAREEAGSKPVYQPGNTNPKANDEELGEEKTLPEAEFRAQVAEIKRRHNLRGI